MVWNNPPKFEPEKPKKSKVVTPEQLAASGSEHASQVALFAWAALSVGKYPPLAYMFAIPNGFFGSAEQKGKMKAEGLRTGVCDVFLPQPFHNQYGDQYGGCFIEMKIEKYRNHKDGGCKPEQVDFINWATSAGYYCKVCYNWVEAKDCLVAYLEGRL